MRQQNTFTAIDRFLSGLIVESCTSVHTDEQSKVTLTCTTSVFLPKQQKQIFCQVLRYIICVYRVKKFLQESVLVCLSFVCLYFAKRLHHSKNVVSFEVSKKNSKIGFFFDYVTMDVFDENQQLAKLRSHMLKESCISKPFKTCFIVSGNRNFFFFNE